MTIAISWPSGSNEEICLGVVIPVSTTVISTPHTEVILDRHEFIRADKKKAPYREVLLNCYSEAESSKEKSLLALFEKRFKGKLRNLHEKRSQPRTRKHLIDIQC